MSVLDSHFEEIQPGDRFVTPGRTITEADVVGFAALTGDTHPQHTDAEWSAAGRFGERIAHGMLVLSYAAGLVPFDPDRVVALRRVGDAVFKAPVRLGDTIHVEGSVEEKRELDEGHGLVTCRWRVLNQHGKLVTRVSVDAVWKRIPQPTAPSPAREPVLI
jgi:3-hydroxybutyryl-CoA dehydratase